MKKNRLVLCLVAAVSVFQTLNAQQPEWCGSVQLIKERIRNNVALQQQFDTYLDWMEQERVSPSVDASRAVTETVYIPVVFHVVHNGDAVGIGENISDAQCLSQIDALNKHFNFQDPDMANVPSVFQNLIANCNIKFCIARYDVNGNPTSGIIRHQYDSVATWNTADDIDNILKPATNWDPTVYLNIWSVRMGGDLTSSGTLAYATIPFGTIGNDDGVVSRYQNIGTTTNVAIAYRKGKTVVHEVGHWLGLLHIWGLDATCDNFGGDFIDDTPQQADLNFGCPAFPHITCNNGPNGDMFVNYMDYTDQDCSAMFTPGQAERMHSVLDGSRASIKSAASGCYTSFDASLVNMLFPLDTVCSLSIKPLVTLKNEGLTVITSGKFYYQIDGGSTRIFDWSGWLGMQDEVVVALPIQNISAGTHILDVTFGNVNGQPADNYSANDSRSVSFYAYDGGGSSSVPVAEGFENDFPAANWQVLNPNNDITWEWNVSFGAFGTSSATTVINNLGYVSNPNKKKDALVTDAYDLTTIQYPEMKFDVAYARYSANRSDSLNLYYSFDCGSNWTKLWGANGAQLATAPDQTTAFFPQPSEWKTISVPLVALNSQAKVQFKFENVTGWGNRLYLDNINITNNPALTVTDVRKEEVKVFPNPTGQLAAVRLPAEHGFRQLTLLNNIGQIVYTTNITDNSVIFSVENLSNGVYLICLSGDNKMQTEKLLINRSN